MEGLRVSVPKGSNKVKISRVDSVQTILNDIIAARDYTHEHRNFDSEEVFKDILNIYSLEKAVIATSHGELIGIAVCVDYHSIPRDIAIVCFTVRTQRMGIGTAIFKEVVKMARETDIAQIRVNTLPKARGFYEKLGFVFTGGQSGIQYTYYVHPRTHTP